MKSKKAFSMSWEVIIGGILAMVILAIILGISLDGFGKGSDEVKRLGTCESKGGTCTTKEVCTGTPVFGFGCPGPDDNEEKGYCCSPKK